MQQMFVRPSALPFLSNFPYISTYICMYVVRHQIEFPKRRREMRVTEKTQKATMADVEVFFAIHTISFLLHLLFFSELLP